MFSKTILLIMAMGAASLQAQTPDTVYLYETIVKHDTLITRDTLYVHDTLFLDHTRREKADRQHHKMHFPTRVREFPTVKGDDLFQGLHIGYTGQFDLMMPAKLTNNESLSSIPGVGGHVGLELSYHFDKWFGVSAALNYGTTGAMRVHYIERTNIYRWEMDLTLDEPIPSENRKRYAIYSTGISMPIKFEFHYPVSPKAWVVADAGLRLRMPLSTFVNGYNKKHDNKDAWVGLTVNIDTSSLTPYSALTLQPDFINRNIFNVDILASVGMYFRLPNNDLFRWNIGFNAALADFSRGHYTYRLYDNVHRYGFWDCVKTINGEYRLRNDHFYAQIAYIHTLHNAKQKRETAQYALKNGNEKLYKHEFKIEASYLLAMRTLQLPWIHFPTGDEESEEYIGKLTPIFSACYHYRVAPWFWIGVSTNYSYYNKIIKVRYSWNGPLCEVGSRSYHLLGIMPDIRFSYLNRPHVTLYSALSAGVDVHISGKYEGDKQYKDYYPDQLFYSAVHATLFGVKAGGKHWFGSFELGVGYKGVVSAGVGYEF